MLKKILIGLAAVVVILFIVVSVQPETYHVERSTTIDAPAEVIWSQVADFNTWKNWSHWDKSDPSQKTVTTGTPGEVGHKTEWDGEKTGTGVMILTAAEAPSKIGLSLEFFTPMAGVATCQFTIAAKGEGSNEVTFEMDGENGFMGKLFGLMMDTDEVIGGAYEETLSNLKVIAEDMAKKQAEVAAAAPETDEGEAVEEGIDDGQ